MTSIAYVFGAVGVLVNYCIYRQTSRKKLLLIKLLSDIVWGVHYVLLSAKSGAITCTISIFRECIFLNKEHKWAQSRLWLLGFMLCNAVSIFFTWKGIISILPACASMVSIFGFWVGNPQLTRRLQIPISLAFLLYNAVYGSFLGIINEIFSLSSIAIYKIQNRKAQSQP